MELVIEKIIEEIEEQLFSRGNFIALTNSEVSEHERGRILGQIEIINKLKMELEIDHKRRSDDKSSSI
jgi:hypothetical protein